jgi:hypothetical protein
MRHAMGTFIAGVTLTHKLSALHHVVAVRDRPGELQKLLYQDDRDGEFAPDSIYGVFDFFYYRRLDPSVGSSSNSKVG